MSDTHLDINLRRSRALPEDTPQQQICITLHQVHVALENEIHRQCAGSMGSATPRYGLVMGECFDVSHDIVGIQKLHATKAQAGAVRNTILRLQTQGLWDLPSHAVITDHEWINR